MAMLDMEKMFIIQGLKLEIEISKKLFIQLNKMYDKTAIEYFTIWWKTFLVIILEASFSRLYGPPFSLVFGHFFQFFGLSRHPGLW